MSKTNAIEFLEELNAGIFKEKLEHILSECALGVIVNGDNKKKGKITVEFTISQIGDNDQVIVSHKLSNSTPTKRGKKYEEDTTETPFFVGKGGVMTINQPREAMNGQFNLVEMKKKGQ